jgi:hypothetical protein
MPTENDATFEFEPALGNYYVSIWTNTSNPAEAMWYGSWGVNVAAFDAQPDVVHITEGSPNVTDIAINVNVPAPHYIAGNVSFVGTPPGDGYTALFSTFPFSPEHPPLGPPSGYFVSPDAAQTLFAFNNIPAGTYYVSLWSNTPPPGAPTFYGAYGYVAGSDTDPDPVVIDDGDNYGALGIDITGIVP